MSTHHWRRQAKDRKRLQESQHDRIKREEMQGTVVVTHADGSVTQEPVPRPRNRRGYKVNTYKALNRKCQYCESWTGSKASTCDACAETLGSFIPPTKELGREYIAFIRNGGSALRWKIIMRNRNH